MCREDSDKNSYRGYEAIGCFGSQSFVEPAMGCARTTNRIDSEKSKENAIYLQRTLQNQLQAWNNVPSSCMDFGSPLLIAFYALR